MADSFPMVVKCFEGQTHISGTEYGNVVCTHCGEITYVSRRYCALCTIKDEIGEIKLDKRELWYG